MKISEGITSLQKLQDKYGDIEILDVAFFVKGEYRDENTANKWIDVVVIENKEVL